jgi:hypothetical protein
MELIINLIVLELVFHSLIKPIEFLNQDSLDLLFKGLLDLSVDVRTELLIIL